ncbi:MAG: MBL fold metallo-hydrolase, partial [Anaerolineae bacterium]|nr:MBL fold metallo-hydrolase [Anaerolineae bacterium]
MKVKIWGARGSVPSPLKPDAIREKIYQAIIGLDSEVDATNPASVRAYVNALPPLVGGTSGGNTACVEVQVGDETCIIDAGSGIRELGLELMHGPCGQGRGRIHLFFSHAHWDHIQGFPFFRPAFVPGNQIFVYWIHPIDWREAVLAPQQSSPFFPVDLDYMKANIEFSRIEPEKPVFIGPAKITHKRLNHPGASYAYRFDEGASTFVYASDAEYKIAMGEASINPYVEFFAGADVLIFDSQLTFKEATEEKLDWGHSTALIGVDLARRAGVKTLVLFHHDPNDTDANLLQAKADALEYQAQTPAFPPVDIEVAYEGLTFDLVSTTTITLNRLPEDDVAILTLAPTLDERQVGELQEELIRLNAAGWPSRLIIDFSHVESLAVVGLNPFITLRREHSDTLIALVGLSERVYRVIKLAGFLDFFKIFDSIDEVLSVPQTPDPTGQLVNGRYRIEDKIGESWLGAVYRATDTQEQTRIAVKILSSSFSEQAIDQFLNQAREILKLDHPNIVNVIDCNQDQHGAYIAQELMEGQTLRDAFSANHRLPVEQA